MYTSTPFIIGYLPKILENQRKNQRNISYGDNEQKTKYLERLNVQ
jgi:hypothetical protein